MKKKHLLFAILIFSVFFNLLCPHLYLQEHQGHNFSCSISSHSFVSIGIGLSALSILPLLGLFPLKNLTHLHEGFVLLPFKPPRFHA